MILHVACLPFPSFQGTQAALDAMLRASAESGRPTHVLTYAHGAYEPVAPYPIHRLPDLPKVRSLRSGPSWGKVALDARCIMETRRLAHELQPNAILAHHIEGALAALAAQVGPVYYVAHTSLRCELPLYFHGLPDLAIAALASRVEAFVCKHAAGVAVVAPSLGELLSAPARYLRVPPHRPVPSYLPVPWKAPSTADRPSRDGARNADRPSRDGARAALDLPPDALVGLYAGNLDRYQGWEHLLEATVALQRTHPQARLLVATQSEPRPLWAAAARLGIADSIDVRPLDSERARALAHSASDLAWVPRRTPGGLPIKMLDAFARGLPVVAMKRATAGLPLEDACVAVPDDDPGALAVAARRLADDRTTALGLCERARHYLATRHSATAFLEAMDHLLGGHGASTWATPDALLRPAAAAPRAPSAP